MAYGKARVYLKIYEKKKLLQVAGWYLKRPTSPQRKQEGPVMVYVCHMLWQEITWHSPLFSFKYLFWKTAMLDETFESDR